MNKIGCLFYNSKEERYDVVFEDGSYHGGLHCGEAFDVRQGDTWEPWEPTRIELDHKDTWYLVGLNGVKLDGLKVRM